MGIPLRVRRNWDNFRVSIGLILVFETFQLKTLDLNETKSGAFYSCNYCEPAKMNCEPVTINASSFADNVSPGVISVSLMFEPKTGVKCEPDQFQLRAVTFSVNHYDRAHTVDRRGGYLTRSFNAFEVGQLPLSFFHVCELSTGRNTVNKRIDKG